MPYVVHFQTSAQGQPPLGTFDCFPEFDRTDWTDPSALNCYPIFLDRLSLVVQDPESQEQGGYRESTNQ